MAVRAVFFDFMGTLARFVPEQEDLLAAAAAPHGINLSPQDAHKGFAAAGDWWNQQLSRLPLEERSRDERDSLYRAFDLRVLRAAGVNVSEQQAYQIFRELMRLARGSRLALFDDVLPALEALQEQHLNLGMISNMGRTLPQILASLGLNGYLSAVVSSGEVGVSKPHPGIFRAALDRAGIAPEEAIFVGDQYENDVVGCRRVGLIPVLVDRYDLFPHYKDCLRVRSLQEVANYLQ